MNNGESSPEIAIVNDHNEVFEHWRKTNLKGATLLHIDGHHDMDDVKVPYQGELDEKYHLSLSIANFICPAIHYGYIDSVYWLNPHLPKKEKLQDFGTTHFLSPRRHLKTRRVEVHPHWIDSNWREGYYIKWAQYTDHLKTWWTEYVYSRYRKPPKSKMISPAAMIPGGKPAILDIDLDAFCCQKNIHGKKTSDNYNGVNGYEQRIEETVDFLRSIDFRPSIITIATSQGDGNDGCFVPPKKVEKILEQVQNEIVGLYIK